jgi:hypothetical protein
MGAGQCSCRAQAVPRSSASMTGVALTVILQHEPEEKRPFSPGRKICTLTLILQHIGRYFDPYLRQSYSDPFSKA